MKKTFRLLALLMLVVTMCFAVVSCDGDSTPENAVITNDFGAKLEGGGFDAGAVLNTEPLAADSAERANAIEKIVEYGVPLEQKAVAVYDIDATKDGVEVQPNGSVRVTIPAPIAEITSYDVFHISDNGSVEILNAVTADGKITFETSSFSTFLVASKLNVGDDVFANAPSYVAPYQTTKLGNATVNINSMYQNYGNFKVGTDATEYFTYQTYTNAGEKITLTAIPNEGYEFVKWTKNGVTVSENATFEYTVTEGSNQLYAQFKEISTYLLSVVHDGFFYNRGTNFINGVGRYGDANIRFKEGESITLGFRPSEGYRYVGLYDNDDNLVTTESTYTFNITADTRFWVRYEEIPNYLLSVTNDGYYYIRGNHKINGKMYGGETGVRFNDGDLVEMEFIPSEGYRYVGLYDDDDNLVTKESKYTFNITADTRFWVKYEETPTHVLYVVTDGYYYNRGTNFINGVGRTGDFGISFNDGDSITLEFRPSEGYRYVGLYDNDDNLITTESEYTFNITADTRFWVRYEEIPTHVLYVLTDGYYYNRGTNVIKGFGITGDAGTRFNEGESITLEFRPSEGYRYVGLYDNDDNLITTESEYTFNITADTTFWVKYEEIPGNVVTVERFGGKINSAMIHMGEKSHTMSLNDEYGIGEAITLSIEIRDDRYKFLGWYDSFGVLVSENETYTFTPDGDTYLFASVVEKSSINVTVGVNSNFEGSFVDETTGKQDTYYTFKIYEGKNEFVSAYANKGYRFVGWYVDEECVSTEATIDLSTFADGTYVQATFEIKETEIGTVTGMWVLGENTTFNMNVGWHFEGDFESRTFTATITVADENVSDINNLYLQCVRFGINGEKLLQPHYELDIDLGNYDPNVVGVYEVYLTYKADPSVVITLVINVISDELYDVQVIAKGGAGEATIVGGGTSAYVQSGTELTFTQTPLSDRIFGGWYYLNSDNSLGEFITYDEECTVKITSDVKIGASYYLIDDRFDVNATAQDDLGYIVIEGQVKNTYSAKAMETVTIAAVANYGYRFVGWYVDEELVSTNATYEYLATADLDIEAKFEGEWILFGAYVDEDGYTGSGNPQNQFLVVRTSPQTGERETITVDHDRVFSLQYGDVVELIAKPMEGYTFVAFRFDETNGEFFGHDGYYKWTVDIAEDNSIIQAFFQPVPASE